MSGIIQLSWPLGELKDWDILMEIFRCNNRAHCPSDIVLSKHFEWKSKDMLSYELSLNSIERNFQMFLLCISKNMSKKITCSP